MATRSRKSAFPDFFGDMGAPEGVRREFIEAPMDAARASALQSLMELAGLLTALPGAFVSSEQRELDRLRATRGDNDPRVEALQASIDRAGALRATAARGEARFKSALAALADREVAFHGFVSTPDLAPLAGLTVRLARSESGQVSSATTDADGYFRISLATGRDAQRRNSERKPADMAERVAEIFGRMNQPTKPASRATENENGPGEHATIEITAEGKVVHRDPAPIPLARGVVYREYVIRGVSSSPDETDAPSPVKRRKAARTTARRTASRARTGRKG